MSGNYYRRVGAARPSHLMYTAGVGALVDLPNFSVLVKGLESWSHTGLLPDDYLIEEPRLRTAVNRALQLYGRAQISELRSAPWMEGADPGGRGPLLLRPAAPPTRCAPNDCRRTLRTTCTAQPATSASSSPRPPANAATASWSAVSWSRSVTTPTRSSPPGI